MNPSMRSLRLYLSNKTYVVAVPVVTLLAMVVVSVLIALVMGIVVGLPLPAAAEEGFRGNLGSLTALPGFLVSVGALAVNRNFAMALAFGSTRRHFWTGTALGFAATSLVTAAAAVVLLALEKLTHGWFVHAHAFDVVAMGSGSYLKTFGMTFVLSALSLFLGALFGTVYRAFGTVATSITAITLGVVLMGLVALGVWQRVRVIAYLADWGLWAVVAIIAGLVLAVAAASYSANRLATF
ncbi:MAG TPA: hypothetical protein VIK31_04910 [Propionibacteriaceae bacterium]